VPPRDSRRTLHSRMTIEVIASEFDASLKMPHSDGVFFMIPDCARSFRLASFWIVRSRVGKLDAVNLGSQISPGSA
jgi:hypothetical protein